ncbi:hypothetical protein A2U01_0067859, partial [Trifolium medium]|nr:hypothetical protein [Trifolium medium]
MENEGRNTMIGGLLGRARTMVTGAAWQNMVVNQAWLK